MEEYIDSFLSSSSWSEAALPERSSWSSIPASQMNGICLESSHESGDKKPDSYVVSLDQILGNMPINGTNNHVHGLDPSACVVHKLNNSYAMLHEQNQLLQKLPETFESNHENLGLSRRLSLPGDTESKLASRLFAGCAGVGSNLCESSIFVQSLTDTQVTASVAPKWLPSYSSIPSLTTDSATLQNLAVPGDYLTREVDLLANGHTNEELLHVGRALNEPGELQTTNAPCYISGSNINLAYDGMHTNYESSNGNPIRYYVDDDSMAFVHPVANPNGPSIATKPRMRARRGQATDPHSIAERLRREKISERMKNLQELVPNPNRTDKASMLDEIIEYVKFLQLQVKVLSMSRLGAAGTVVPLLTDFKQEEAREMVLSSSMDTVHDLSLSQDDIEFEQDVLKFMESNVTAALQFLQSKGLCLMPVALASAISSRKGSSITAPPHVRKKPISTASITPHRADSARKEKRDRLEKSNGCNGSAVKHEEGNKGTSSSRL